MRDGWKALPLSDVVEHTIGGVWGGESGTDEIEVTVVRSTEFTKRGYLNFETGVSRSIKQSQLKSRELKEGDILLEKSGGGPDQPVGRVVYVTAEIPNKFVCSNFVQLVRPNSLEIEPLLLFHIMWQWHAINRTLEFQAQTTGIRNLRTPDYLEQEINLPPLPEQKRIIDLISAVDSYIQALQQQLESGKKSRNAVLHELLTAGGDDWVETTIGQISKCAGGCAFPDAFQGNTEGIPFIKVSDMNLQDNEKYIETSNNSVSAEVVENLRLRVWDKGTVIFPKVGAALLTEKRRILTTKTIFDNNIMGLVPNERVLSEFLFLLMLQIRFSDHVQPGAVPSIKNSIVEAISVQLPPLSEQRRIVAIVSELDGFIHRTETSINRTGALRAGLLSDLLSGKHEIPASYDKIMGAA